jgi:D-glycero-alpha-D-manno-heptose 1-phosphate guanylyltransferase
MIKEAIILAGGLGTRLRSAVPDLPKCMAPIHDRPFISYVINYLHSQGVERFIFSLGYMHEAIASYIKSSYTDLDLEFIIEEEPLGTGGAIKFSCNKAKSADVFITNGDTFFDIDAEVLSDFHLERKADCTLSLKPMQKFDRYGVVTLDENNRINSFKEKRFYEEGLINGGLYALNVSSFLNEDLPKKFSFEQQYLEAFHGSRYMYGCVQDAYFIDIGIPEDYKKAQAEL